MSIVLYYIIIPFHRCRNLERFGNVTKARLLTGGRKNAMVWKQVYLTHMLLQLSPAATASFLPFLSGRAFLPGQVSRFLELIPSSWLTLPSPRFMGYQTLEPATTHPGVLLWHVCRVENGDRLGNFPVCKELVILVWGKAHTGFQHLSKYCRAALPTRWSGGGRPSPRTIRH